NACNYADLASVAATGPVGQAAQDAAELYGDLCGIAGGTWARDRANNQIKELTQNLWSASIDALSGP
ncbi:MAG TPA: hypothetical protein VEJ18_20320, partial [Planctomycetota bacterium]|nr:hypothetical protein [Planctomycetota bacterium]